MGAGLSSKFVGATVKFDVGYWRIATGTQKSDGKRVSIWAFDYDDYKKAESDKKTRKKYLAFLELRVRAQMKLMHPGLLEIYDIKTAKNKLYFVTCPVISVLAQERNITRDEAMNICGTLADIMNRVHNDLHLAVGSLCPNNVFLTETFTPKVGLFLDATTFQYSADQLDYPFTKWEARTSPYHIPDVYAPPEVIKTSQFSAKSDVYMYGLCCIQAFTNCDPVSTGWEVAALKEVPSEFQQLLKNCLAPDPFDRPGFGAILENEAFSSMVYGVFKYIHALNDEVTSRDLYNFFTGLKKIVHVFSPRITRCLLFTVFIKYLNKDPRFGPIIIPMMISVEGKFDDTQFIDEILVPIQPALNHMDVPRNLELYLDEVNTLVARVPEAKRNELLIGPLFKALESDNVPLLKKALDVLPYVLKIMRKQIIDEKLFSSLLLLFRRTAVDEIANTAVIRMIMCSFIGDSDTMFSQACATFMDDWKRRSRVSCLSRIVDFLYVVDSRPEVRLEYGMSLLSTLLRSDDVDVTTKTRIIKLMGILLNDLKSWLNITDSLVRSVDDYKMDDYSIPTTPYKRMHLDVPQGDPLESESEQDEEEEEDRAEEDQPKPKVMPPQEPISDDEIVPPAADIPPPIPDSPRMQQAPQVQTEQYQAQPVQNTRSMQPQQPGAVPRRREVKKVFMMDHTSSTSSIPAQQFSAMGSYGSYSTPYTGSGNPVRKSAASMEETQALFARPAASASPSNIRHGNMSSESNHFGFEFE